MDAARFAKRFGVPLTEGYVSSEGGAALQRPADAPPGAAGRGAPGTDLAVVNRSTGEELPRGRLDGTGRLVNGDEAIRELVNRAPNPFEGYWKNQAADTERTRRGWFWTGDPVLPRPGRLVPLRRARRGPAAGGRREPGGSGRRGDPGPLPGRRGGGRASRPRPRLRRPGDGRARSARGRRFRPGRLRRVPGRTAGSGCEDSAPGSSGS